ncbi:hypothetical protein GA0115240_142323 [Streptomyces sp. DvalAA-14]|uniref:hypothetical protein n=1 Tax=unclassified Streptomyces TaxID=2593676 RepID=UPI00081B7903|nr:MULTISPECIES: hypothetical protein [unclassified Streptomyces]MYS22586.1 hypothetical protein [Streptomyces sp. SID4948]SCE18796.1 hypothetical protein GA0115240_142323 [Streptomyces sp. DvalAA-14]
MRSSEERKYIIEQQKKFAGHSVRIWVQDGWRDFEVYRVPVDALLLNADNRRFRAERMWAEEHLGRQLDPENNPADEISIASLLLDVSHRVEGDQVVGKPSGSYESLRNDWIRRKQESPLWIRPDGTVRNGNRRLSMVKRLQREIGSTGLEWVQTIILPIGEIDEPSLLEMEQREQLTENFKVRYNDIDYLLALREAAENRDVDWFDRESIESVAGELQSMVEKSKGEVVRDLFAVKYMDIFLEDSEQAGQYHRLLKTLERFRDIGRMMMQVEEQYPQEAAQILQTLFAAVRANKGHLDIRAIRAMFKSDRPRFDKLASTVADAEAGWDVTAGPSLSSPGSSAPIDTGGEEEIETDDEGPGPDVANYPKGAVGSAIELAIDGFSASQQDDVAQVLQEVCNRLDVLTERDRLSIALSTDEGSLVREKLNKIFQWVEANRHFTDRAK